MIEKMLEQVKSGNIVLPRVLLVKYKDLNLTDQELIVTIYLLNSNNVFNPKEISEMLKINLPEVMAIMDSLMTKDIVNIEVTTINSLAEEKVNFDGMYKKIVNIIVNEKELKEKETIYDIFEKEFNRTLSPVEFELIGAWIDSGVSEELLNLALKEAVYNGVFNLKYIDKIIYEWSKKGIKTKEDVQKDKENFKSSKETKKELFDYDWLNDSDE